MPAPSAASRDDRCRFDRAVVLFNHGAYFEAHEDWELLWHEAVGRERLWLQGLIQLAAAFVHFERGFFARGFARLMADATAKLDGYDGPDWGLDLERLDATLRPWREHAGHVAAGRPMDAGAPTRRPRLHAVQGYVPEPLALERDPEDEG